jgi:hypothetical protein
LSQNLQYFFRRNYFQNHNIDPWRLLLQESKPEHVVGPDVVGRLVRRFVAADVVVDAAATRNVVQRRLASRGVGREVEIASEPV